MRCPFCVEEGERSIVNVPGYSTRTLMMGHSFYDEDGRLHSHDPNVSSADYSCSRGHRWIHSSRSSCGVDGCEWERVRASDQLGDRLISG